MTEKPVVFNVIEDGRIAGPQLRMLRVANALHEAVNTVVVIPKKGPSDFKDALVEADISFVELPLTKFSRSITDIFLSLIKMPYEINCLKKSAIACQADVVHSSGGAWMFKAIIAARLAGIPSVWHLNDTSSPSIFKHIARLLIKRWVAGVIVAGSRVKSHYLPDFETYTSGVEIIKIEAPVDTNKFRSKNRYGQNKRLSLITVGNVSPVKGYETLVHAANELKGNVNFSWRVFGYLLDSQKSYQNRIFGKMDDLGLKEVKIMGASSKVDLMLMDSDIYVCTSEAEASPTSVWEAMACGLPIIATDVGCVSDYIQHGVNGYIVPVGDFSSIAKYIKVLDGDISLRKEMGMKNRKLAEEYFDIEVCARKHLCIYSSVSS